MIYGPLFEKLSSSKYLILEPINQMIQRITLSLSKCIQSLKNASKISTNLVHYIV